MNYLKDFDRNAEINESFVNDLMEYQQKKTIQFSQYKPEPRHNPSSRALKYNLGEMIKERLNIQNIITNHNSRQINRSQNNQISRIDIRHRQSLISESRDKIESFNNSNLFSDVQIDDTIQREKKIQAYQNYLYPQNPESNNCNTDTEMNQENNEMLEESKISNANHQIAQQQYQQKQYQSQYTSFTNQNGRNDNDVEMRDIPHYSLNESLIESQSDLQSLYEMKSFPYQDKICQKCLYYWDKEPYGSIIFLETGSGKSYIAIKMIQHIFGFPLELNLLSEEKMLQKRQKQIIKKAFDPQHFQNHDIFICISKKFYDLMLHGVLSFKDIDLLIFDEAHHCEQDHFQLQEFGIKTRILGLTASPVKSKIMVDDIYKFTLKTNLQTLSNNLYSRFIPIEQHDLNQMKNQAYVYVETYDSKISENIDFVSRIEQELIKPLLDLVQIKLEIYKMIDLNEKKSSQSEQLMKLCNRNLLQQSIDAQDIQMEKFISGRLKLIELDIDLSKKQIDLGFFNNDQDRTIVILAITLLKNINNLIIELGQHGVNFFIHDLNKEIIQQQGKIDSKKQKIEQIFQQYIHNLQLHLTDPIELSVDRSLNENYYLSGKVNELIRILEKEYESRKQQEQNQNLKAIIFVKDRIVAEYLKRILESRYNQQNNQSDLSRVLDDKSLNLDDGFSIDDEELQQQQLNYQSNSKFKFGLAIGYQGKSMMNKAYKSTKVPKNDDIEDYICSLPKFSPVQLSNQKLNETIMKFRKDVINVLIATSVIEEGLDVSSCNLVICLNEILSVKSFIQTKGRARQSNSKFIFLCAHEEKDKYNTEISGFNQTIRIIQEIAYDQEESVVPDSKIIEKKIMNQPPSLRTPLQAKCSMRDAPSLVKQLVQELNQGLSDKQFDLSMIFHLRDQNQAYINCVNQHQELRFDMSRLKINIIVITDEKRNKNQQQFSSTLIMPHSLKCLISHIKDTQLFSKKNEAENHVYLLALFYFYELGFLDQNLYSNLESIRKYPSIIKKLNNIQPEPKIKVQVIQDPNAPKQPSKKEQNLHDRELLNEESKLFQQQTKERGNKFSFQVKKDLINKTFNQRVEYHTEQVNESAMDVDYENQSTIEKHFKKKLYAIVIHGLDDEYNNNNYPFLDTKQHLGIIQDEDLEDIRYQYNLQQDVKQKQKNKFYLENLWNFKNFDEAILFQKIQMSDELKFTKSSFEIKDFGPYSSLWEFSNKLNLFHTWIFFMIYNNQHQFFQRLIMGKFSFSYLFQTVFQLIIKDKRITLRENRGFLQYVYELNKEQVWGNEQFDPKKIHDQKKINIQTYIIPIKDQNGVKEINFKLIDQLESYIKVEMIKFFFSDYQVHKTIQNLGLEHDIYSKFLLYKEENQFKNIHNNSILDEDIEMKMEDSLENQISHSQIVMRQPKFNNLEYIQVCESNHNLYQIMSLKKQTDKLWHKKQIHLLPNKYKREYPNVHENTLKAMYGENLTLQEHYFAKTGIYLDKKENQIFFKCSKMRHFLDYSQQKTPEDGEKTNSKYPEQHSSINTEFDVPLQLLGLTPFTYEQYQVLQSTCFHLSQINEMQIVRQFIIKFYSKVKIINGDPLINLQLEHPVLNIHQIALQPPDSNTFRTAADFFLYDPSCIIEALSSPTANRPIDYERLEFYGDSVISFLVILELFLCGSKSWSEGDLDFNRIKKVSNRNFININERIGLYQYMISEQAKIYNDYVPVGFETQDYMQNIKLKHLNELTTKIIHLKKQAFFIELEKKKNFQQCINDFVTEEYIELTKLFITQRDLNLYLVEKHPKAIQIIEEEKMLSYQTSECLLTRIGQRWINELSLKIPQLKEIVVNENIKKCYRKLDDEMKKRYKSDQIPNREKKLYQPKQLADVVESITGALTFKTNLFTTQSFLKSEIKLLEHEVEEYDRELDQLRLGEVQLTDELSSQIAQLEGLLGYSFQSKHLVLQALTHKSTKEHSSQVQGSYHDYERLEFFGDSILNFLVAQYYFLTTQFDPDHNKPKQLHKYKTSVVNNVLLSLIVIEKGIYNSIIYNQQSKQFKDQFDKYVQEVQIRINNAQTMDIARYFYLNNIYGQRDKIEISHRLGYFITRDPIDYDQGRNHQINNQQYLNNAINVDQRELQKLGVIDLDELHESSLKIFGDIFESIIGAIFIDSKSLEITSQILFNLLKPYMVVYGNIDPALDHKRTVLLELWNSKVYSKNLKLWHKLQILFSF
ncbi:cre-dcr-1 protein [Stylonychia lemnae]|uniref:Cre-dcr-1 protein n=1 Tax=Stylonychia lemnae TaxID=5949 RepID=A0A077ZWZ5_STYLE|nr:cre-dcr-1 protein [Stylonychia lemnae]|eukprot:CDW74385.1 cre-dcr-1 protein [Stylonychia lemnae]